MTENSDQRIAENGWIAIDWGTSNLRAWIMADRDTVICELSSPEGMGQLEQTQFEEALLRLIGPFLPQDATMPIICCGMVGARQGWLEAPYVNTPCPPPGSQEAVSPQVHDKRLDVFILPGVSQSSPADVMRGEETQIAGFLAQDPDFDGVICLPGTHTKWVLLKAGRIMEFRTFMSGELFELASEQSVLRHGFSSSDWDDGAFDRAVGDGYTYPASLANEMFAIRAGQLLHGLSPGAARARLSGLMIGAEIAATRPFWERQKVILIGAPGLTKLYSRALAQHGVETQMPQADTITLAGLKAAYQQMGKIA